MAALLILIMLYAFLLLGAFMFVTSFAARPLRKYALSIALWCAAMGPCVVALMLFAGLALLAEGFSHDYRGINLHELPIVGQTFWKAYGIVGLLGSAVTCTFISWFHQFVIHRMTFALFRHYTTAVCTGMGSVWAILLAPCLEDIPLPYRIPIWILGFIFLCLGFGYLGFRSASSLRGNAPEKFTWVTASEFAESPHQGEQA